jgi:hypothetical protein
MKGRVTGNQSLPNCHTAVVTFRLNIPLDLSPPWGLRYSVVPESVEFSSPDPFLLHRPMTRRPAMAGPFRRQRSLHRRYFPGNSR